MAPVYNNMQRYSRVGKRGFAALLLLLLSTHACAQSLSFGSITDTKQLTINKGEQKAFKASFFNTGSETAEVELVARYMSDLRVEITPASLNLYSGKTTSPSSSEGAEWFVLSDGRTYVETKPVYIYVKVPEEVSSNSYEITLVATAKTKRKDGASGVSQQLKQAREIVFRVYVPGELTTRREPKYIIETNGSSRNIIGPYNPSIPTPQKSGVVYGTSSEGLDTNTGFTGEGSGGANLGTSGGTYSTATLVRKETSGSGTQTGAGQDKYSTEGGNMRYIPSSSEGNRPGVYGETQSAVAELSSIIGNALNFLNNDELSGLGIIPLLFIIAYLARKITSKGEDKDARWKK